VIEAARYVSGLLPRTAMSSAARTTVWIAMPPSRLPTAMPRLWWIAAVEVMAISGRLVPTASKIVPASACPRWKRLERESVVSDSQMPAAQTIAAETTKMPTRAKIGREWSIEAPPYELLCGKSYKLSTWGAADASFPMND